MFMVSSVSSLAGVVIAASMSFTANVMPVATGAPSHAENAARIVGSQPSRVEAQRSHPGTSATRNGGVPSVASNLSGERAGLSEAPNGDMGNLPVGARPRHREGLPSMTGSSEGEVSAFR